MVPDTRGFGTGSGTIEPVPWNGFLRQITTYSDRKMYTTLITLQPAKHLGC